MQEKLKKNLYYLSILAIFLLGIILFRLCKLYDICCLVFSITMPIIFGYIFAWVFRPLFLKLSNKIGNKLSIGLLAIAMTLFYVFLIWKLLPIIYENVTNLFNVLEIVITKFESYPFLASIKDMPKLDIDIILGYCGNLISFLGVFALMHIFGFYILYNYDWINKFLIGLIPQRHKKISLKYLKDLSYNMRQYIKGTLLDTLILFLISSFLYIVIGLKYPILLAFFSAITNIIPFIGPYIGGIPAVIVGVSSSLRLGVITLCVIIIAQTVESNFINPLIMSKCIKVNPILIIIALTVMGRFFGLIGMLFAVPLIIVIKITLDYFKKYKMTSIAKKEKQN